MKHVKSVIWTVLSRAVAVGGQVAFFLVVARAVGPDIIGVFALASVVAFAIARIASTGWQQYASSHVHDPARLKHCAHAGLLSAILASAISLVIVLVSFSVTETSTFALILLALTPTTFISPLAATPTGVLIGRGELSRLAKLSILSDLSAAAAALVVLFLGAGIWTLVVHRSVMTIVTLVAAQLASGLELTRMASMPDKPLRQFYLTFFLTGLLQQIRENTTLFIAGGVAGATGAGLYRTAARLNSAVVELTREAITRLAWSHFSHSDGRRYTTEEGSKFSAVAFGLTAPIFVGLSLVSGPVIALFLGDEWTEAGAILCFLALAGGLRIQLAGLTPALAGAKNFRQLLWLTLVPTSVVIAAMFIAMPLGLVAIGVSVLAAEIAALIQRFYIAVKTEHIDSMLTLKYCAKPVGAVVLMVMGVEAAGSLINISTPLVVLAVKMTTGVAIWLVAGAAFYPHISQMIVQKMRSVLPA